MAQEYAGMFHLDQKHVDYCPEALKAEALRYVHRLSCIGSSLLRDLFAHGAHGAHGL
jgi:hypothetical protein